VIDLLLLFLWIVRRLNDLLLPNAWTHSILGQVLSSHAIVSSTTVRLCSPWGGRWDCTLEDKIGWPFVILRHTHRLQNEPYPICASRSWNITHLIHRQLSRNHPVLGRAIPWGGVLVLEIKVRSLGGVVQPLCIPSVYCPAPHSCQLKWWVTVRRVDYKWVCQFETFCICTWWTDEQWSRCPGIMAQCARDNVAPLRQNWAVWVPLRIGCLLV